MLTVLFSLVCILYVMPIVEVLINSFKTHSAINTDTFALPNAGTFAGTSNYVKGMTFGNYPFLKSLLYSIVITILSVTLILLCTSMAAWFISRVGGRFSRLFYLGCVFSMIVPFQMVMFPLVSWRATAPRSSVPSSRATPRSTSRLACWRMVVSLGV